MPGEACECRCRCGSVTLDPAGKDSANLYAVVQSSEHARSGRPDKGELLAVRINGWDQSGAALVFDPLDGSLRPIREAIESGPGYYLIGAFRGGPSVAIGKARARLRAILAGKDVHGLGVVYSEAYDRRE